jgi:hypothetical protein
MRAIAVLPTIRLSAGSDNANLDGTGAAGGAPEGTDKNRKTTPCKVDGVRFDVRGALLVPHFVQEMFR